MQGTRGVRAVRSGVVLALAACFAWATRAQGPAAEAGATGALRKVSKALPTNALRPAAKPQSGQPEGIKVHGDWTIVIRNEDGSVASRHQFKNALVDFAVLPLLLAHGGSVGAWTVRLAGPDLSNQPCLFSALNLPSACQLQELANGGNLSVTNSGTSLTLVGSRKAQVSSPLTTVETGFVLCNPTQGPSLTCQAAVVSTLTRKDISAQNIQVVAGQTIDVTVVISFS